MNKKGKRLLCGKDVRAHRRFCGGRFDHRVEVRSHESQANSTQLPMRNKIFRPHGRVAGWGEALRVDSTIPPVSLAIPYEVRTARFVTYRSPAPTHTRKECLMNGRSGSQKSPQHGIPLDPQSLFRRQCRRKAATIREIASHETSGLPQHSVEEIRGDSLERLFRKKWQRVKIRRGAVLRP